MTARFFLGLALLSLTLPTNLIAQESDEVQAYSTFFNGDFVELSARAGVSEVSDLPKTSRLFELGIRQALPMHLLDTRLAFGLETFSGDADADVDFYSLNISGAFHPFYLALLFENWFGWVIASLYFEAGLGAHYGISEGQKDFGFAYSFGAGMDFPLWNPNHGWSIWVNGLYRYRRMDFDFSNQEIELHNHAGILGVSVRWNGLLF